jgi:hypothetical protein
VNRLPGRDENLVTLVERAARLDPRDRPLHARLKDRHDVALLHPEAVHVACLVADYDLLRPARGLLGHRQDTQAAALHRIDIEQVDARQR